MDVVKAIVVLNLQSPKGLHQSVGINFKTTPTTRMFQIPSPL